MSSSTSLSDLIRRSGASASVVLLSFLLTPMFTPTSLSALFGPGVAHAQAGEADEEQKGVQGEQDDREKEAGEQQAKAPAEMSAEEVAERIQKFYRQTKDYQAEFRQVYTDVAAGDTKKNWGRVYFKKPGQMRWDYYESEGLDDRKKTLVSDGEVFWIYELEFKQVFKKCLSESQLPTSLKFLMGEGELLEDFDVAFTEESTDEAPELELTPKEPTPKYKKVHFKVDPETFQVRKTTVFDPYGNTNAIWFDKAKVNKNLPDSGFDFEPPKDARMLNPQKDC